MADTALATNGTHEKTFTTHETLTVLSQMLQRVALTRAGMTFNGARDLYETLGYSRDLRFEDYKQRYARGGIAARIIDAFPSATWRTPPVIREKGKPDETKQTPFEAAWETLATRLNIWQVLARADRLASLGHYAVLVVGLRGQTSWGVEAGRVSSPDDVLYLKAYSEEHASIKSLVSDEKSPLFGRPGMYTVDFSRRASGAVMFDDSLRPTLGEQYGSTVDVHASRVLHIAENGLEDDIIGTPRLRAIWNYLDDLDKEVGSVAEMAWTDALRRFVLAIDSDATMSDEAAATLSDEAEEFAHKRRAFFRAQGMKVTQLLGEIPDASANIQARLELIAGTVRMPKRMLVGSERGELASSQDENNWTHTIIERCRLHAEPHILRPVIDFGITCKALPAPQHGYIVEWENPAPASEKDQAETALAWARTIATYAGPLGSPQEILPLPIFLEDVLKWPKDQVKKIMDLLDEELRVDAQSPDAAL